MRRKLIMTTVVAFTFAGATTGSAAQATAPASPGACNMLHVSTTGMDGMGKAKVGLDNMMALINASIEAGCTP